MGVFRQFPYSNFHEMNMDEIIKIIKNMLEEWAQYYNTWDNWKEQVTSEWEEMKTFINNYFDNLDVQNEINNKITAMVETGEFSLIVEPYVPPAVADWLAEHITTPETVVIDDSLSIAGACADAKATGDAIKDVRDTFNEAFDIIRIRSYNLLDMTNHEGWYPATGKDVSVIPLGNSNLRIKSNVSQTYAAARYDIDTTNITSLYTKRGSTSGTGTFRSRLYSVVGTTYTSLGSIGPDGVVFDVSSYDKVCVELCATTTTASTNYIDYEPILVKAGSEPAPFIPYYIYNPQDYETMKFDWVAYDSSTSLSYNNRVKNVPLYVSNGATFVFDPGENDFRCTYHLYSTYEKAMESFNSRTYIAGDIYSSGTLKEAPVREYINNDCWIMVIGYLAGDPNPEISANDVPSGNTLNRLRTDAIIEIENAISGPQEEGIVKTNQLAGNKLYNAKFRSKRVLTDSRTILSLINFADIHGDSESLQRIIEFRSSFADYIDDAICLGDMVRSQTDSTAMAFWNAVEGAEDILLIIGNHDVWKSGSETWTPSDFITQTEAYNRYIAPYVANWDVEYTENHTYYYKDYDEQKIRLVCLDMMLSGDERTAELTWLESVLADAITDEMSVVIAEHFAPRPNTNFACNFTALDGVPSTTEGWSPESTFLDAVEDFKTNGGDFICWLAGHTHCDYVCYNPNYPEQLFITITCARISETYSDQARIRGTQSQDAFNIVSFDAYQKLIKIIRVGANNDAYLRDRNSLTINYATRAIIESD